MQSPFDLDDFPLPPPMLAQEQYPSRPTTPSTPSKQHHSRPTTPSPPNKHHMAPPVSNSQPSTSSSSSRRLPSTLPKPPPPPTIPLPPPPIGAGPMPNKTNSSSRSDRVIKQLNEQLDITTKDLTTIRAQLETARGTKQAAEQTSAEMAASTAELRIEIQQLMDQVEQKDVQMRENKHRDRENEQEVKKLREDALAARKHLDDMSKRERSILDTRDQALAAREKAEREHTTLLEALDGLRRRYRDDIAGLQVSLAHIRGELATASGKGVRVAEETEGKVRVLLDERNREIERLRERQKAMEKNSAAFVESVRLELEALQMAVEASGQRTEACQDRIKGARLELDELLRRIKTFKEEAEAAANGEEATVEAKDVEVSS